MRELSIDFVNRFGLRRAPLLSLLGLLLTYEQLISEIMNGTKVINYIMLKYVIFYIKSL